jgi:hypothetical protein
MGSFVALYMFNPGYGNLKAKIGFVYGAFMLIFAVTAWFSFQKHEIALTRNLMSFS